MILSWLDKYFKCHPNSRVRHKSSTHKLDSHVNPLIYKIFKTRLRNMAIKYCKVQWKHHPEREATWQKEEDLRRDYPYLFRYLVP